MSKLRAIIAAFLAAGLVLSLTVNGSAATQPSSSAVAPSTAVTVSKQVARSTFDAAGQETVTDSRTVAATVSDTQNLADRQQVNISWSGAHPTGGRVPDPTGLTAPLQEYPFLLMQCRGVDSATTAIDRHNCWTTTVADRNAQDTTTAYPAWRLDHYAAATDRTASVETPTGCAQANVLAQHWLPFVSADAKTYAFGPGAKPCGALPPEDSSDPDSLPLPTNNQFAFSDSNGNGSTQFEIRSTETYSSLGCSDTVACSIVMVPIEGISCDARDGGSATDLTGCETQGSYAAGQRYNSSGIANQPAVTGQLWWADSNWRNRMSVPITLRQNSNVCDITDTRLPTDLYGSELMAQATTQWEPYFCLDPAKFKFRHVHLGEPPARALLGQSTISADLVSEPTGNFSFPYVNAPVGITGWGIAFNVDKADGSGSQQSLKLTPRLVAKLLTESYPTSDGYVRQSDVPLSHNPSSITSDPEFIALNPGVISTSDVAQSTLINLSSDSDVVYAMTSWIAADPDAAAWLTGRPDPWGMVVNPNYKGITLPTQTWPLLDNFIPAYPKSSGTVTQYSCFNASPSPYGNLVASPTGTLAAIETDVQYAHPTASLGCAATADDPTSLGLKRNARQPGGARFVLGLVALGDAARFGLATASLQTQVLSNAAAKFKDATGRVFVSATQNSLRDAAGELSPNATTNAWSLSYSNLRSDPAAVAAYPGMLPVYAQVPTSGLSPADASHLSSLLVFAATTGQVPGTANGNLPDGYLPMTAANGLGAFDAYTEQAAAAVAGQTGAVPLVVPASAVSAAAPKVTSSTSPPANPTNKASSAAAKKPASAAPASGGVTSGGTAPSVSISGVAPLNPTVAAASLPPLAAATQAATPAAAGNGITKAAGVRAQGVNSALGGAALPVLLLVLLVGVLIGPVTRLGGLGKGRTA